MRHTTFLWMACGMIAASLCACSDDEQANPALGTLVEGNPALGQANEVFSAEEWYPGGVLGTTENASYSAPAPAVTNVPGMEESFNKGEDYFEHLYTITEAPRKGLGPAWTRNSCIACHPNYGHGKRQTQYRANTMGNGYLLVIYHPQAGVDRNGNAYAANSYITEVTGMPQTQAMHPFKAPVDESQISIEWKEVGEMPSGLPMAFADGETYSLIYPEVTIPETAFHTDPIPNNYEVRLESTIGIYGTGLLDAIDQEDMKKVYMEQAAQGVSLNPGIWDTAANDWAAGAWYTLADGQKKVKKFTYAMTRASLQDGAGANAIWNITNVTRSDRHYLYTTKAWAKAMSQDEEVINYILANGNDKSSVLYPYWADTKEGVAQKVNTLLGLNSSKDKATFEQYFLLGAPYNGEEEMSSKDYYDFMVWHRGLAVPAARNLDRADVKRGKQLFTKMGCASCHKPSWTTGEDNYWVDDCIKEYAAANGKDVQNVLPRFSKQVIWPYTDMVQHRLFMINDIRTGWCRTTPLWGRGLSMRLTGASDRLHDCRARTVIEAIMWHAYSKQSDAYWSAEQFFYLNKEERDAVVAFIEAI
ncbi:MAG: di-heme oxidoredictase family protein [Prevotella sp.]